MRRIIPPITPVENELTVEAATDIIATAQRAQARRRELVTGLKDSLEAGEISEALRLVRELCGLEQPKQQ